MSPYLERRLRSAVQNLVTAKRNQSPELSPARRFQSVKVWDDLVARICADIGRLAEIEAGERADAMEREIEAQIVASEQERAA